MPTDQIQDDYAPSAWSTSSKLEGFDHVVPSGQRCRLRMLNLEQLVINGVIDDIDAVSKIISSDIMKKRAGRRTRQTEAQEAIEGLKFMQSDAGKHAVRLMDKIIPYAVVAPQVMADPDDPADRLEGVVYVSSISITDRADIFSVVIQSVNGVAQFRGGSAETLGAASAG